MSNAFAALIWWVLPAVGLTGALGYVVWVTKFEGKFQQETQRSVGQFQRFQDSLRDSQARDAGGASSIVALTTTADQGTQSDSDSSDSTGVDSGTADSGSSTN